MPPFPNSEHVIRACEGPCGRMTRPSKVTAAAAAALGFPDTITRYDGKRCGVCWKALPENAPSPEEQARLDTKAARKAALAADRLESAHRARQAMEVERAARQNRRIVRRVGLGQTGVRI